MADLAAPVLDPADATHLLRALRLRPGEAVSTVDGAGAWRPCVLRDGGRLEPTGAIEAWPTPGPPVTVGLVAPKGDRLDWAVQKLTEVGADAIVVLTSERAVVRWDPARTPRQLSRLGVIARQAAMQSRRPTVPTVSGPVALAALVGPVPEAGALGPVALAEPGGPAPDLATPTVLIGPEGGWSPAELAAVPARVGLGPWVLRTETAAVVAAAALVGLRRI